MDIHIDLESLKMFVAIVVAGSVYGHYLYKRGLRKGWDDLAFELEDAGIINVDEETGEITRAAKKF